MKLLDVVGRDAKGLFRWAVSAQGQKVIHVAEEAVEIAVPNPLLVDWINVINKWMGEIAFTQAISVPAGMETGSNEDKAAMTISRIEPVVLQFIADHKWPIPSPARLKLINDSLVIAFGALENGALDVKPTPGA